MSSKTKVAFFSASCKLSISDDYVSIYIPGTDDWRDMLINLDCLPNQFGFHNGAYKKAEEIYVYMNEHLNEDMWSKPIRLKGHSMGGAIAECLAHILERCNCEVHSLALYGSYGVSRHLYGHSYPIMRVRCGKDAIPLIIPWNYNITTLHTPTESDWPLRFAKDHTEYDCKYLNLTLDSSKIYTYF